MNIKREIKILLATECTTITEIAKKINDKNKRKLTRENLSQKIHRNSMKINDFEEILDVLGYELVIKKKQY